MVIYSMIGLPYSYGKTYSYMVIYTNKDNMQHVKIYIFSNGKEKRHVLFSIKISWWQRKIGIVYGTAY